METSMESLRKRLGNMCRILVPRSTSSLPADASWFTIAPIRNCPAEFLCARAPGKVEGTTLWIDKEVYQTLRIEREEKVQAMELENEEQYEGSAH